MMAKILNQFSNFSEKFAKLEAKEAKKAEEKSRKKKVKELEEKLAGKNVEGEVNGMDELMLEQHRFHNVTVSTERTPFYAAAGHPYQTRREMEEAAEHKKQNEISPSQEGEGRRRKELRFEPAGKRQWKPRGHINRKYDVSPLRSLAPLSNNPFAHWEKTSEEKKEVEKTTNTVATQTLVAMAMAKKDAVAQTVINNDFFTAMGNGTRWLVEGMRQLAPEKN